jgi:hypothetical protein
LIGQGDILLCCCCWCRVAEEAHGLSIAFPPVFAFIPRCS